MEDLPECFPGGRGRLHDAKIMSQEDCFTYYSSYLGEIDLSELQGTLRVPTIPYHVFFAIASGDGFGLLCFSAGGGTDHMSERS